jgi:translocation and assembly module TamA
VVGAAHNWGVETTPSQVSLSSHLEQQRIEGSNTENNYALYASFRKTFRYTDDPIQPRRGLLGSLHAGTSVPGVGTQDFVRGLARLNWIIPVGRHADITLRSELGAVLASERSGIPSSFLFRTGGDQTIRGYAFESIGVPQGNAIVGGRYLAWGSAEYTYWFTGDLGAAVFVDGGDAFDRRQEMNTAIGYGIGARYRSPIGPFRADIAYGERTQALRLHFSVGYNF